MTDRDPADDGGRKTITGVFRAPGTKQITVRLSRLADLGAQASSSRPNTVTPAISQAT